VKVKQPEIYRTHIMRGYREGGTLESNLIPEDKPSSVFSVVAV
jgi:hypothetical protein